MRIEIQNKIITETATNIGVAIQIVSETTASVNYSLNDDAGNSIISGNDIIEGTDTNTIIDNLFSKLQIQRKNDTATSTKQP